MVCVGARAPSPTAAATFSSGNATTTKNRDDASVIRRRSEHSVDNNADNTTEGHFVPELAQTEHSAVSAASAKAAPSSAESDEAHSDVCVSTSTNALMMPDSMAACFTVSAHSHATATTLVIVKPGPVAMSAENHDHATLLERDGLQDATATDLHRYTASMPNHRVLPTNVDVKIAGSSSGCTQTMGCALAATPK